MDKEGVVDLVEGHAMVAAEVEDLGGGAVDVEELPLVRRYLQMILMLIWRNIIPNQCRQIKSTPHVCWSVYISACCKLICALKVSKAQILCISINIQPF